MNDKIGASRLQILRYFSLFTSFIGIIILLPLILLIFYHNEYREFLCFLLPGLILILIGIPLSIFLRKIPQNRLKKNEEAVLVLSIWLYSSLLLMTPYLIKGEFNFTEAFFESVSGLSTTGFTLLDTNSLSHLFIFYRTLTYLVGGVGLILIFTSALNDSFGAKLYMAEGHNDRLASNLLRSSRLFISMYLGYIFVGIIAYLVCGLNFFDALIYSTSAVATGGVGSHSEGIMYFTKNRLAIEIITIILMILGSINFVIHTFILKLRFKDVWHHCETKLYTCLSIFFIIIMTFSLFFKLDYHFSTSFRISVFQFFSSITGTGYQIISNITSLPSVFVLCMVLCFLIGGAVGSCSGGIKQYRICLLLKSMHWNFLEMNNSKNIIIPYYINRYDKKILVSDKEIKENYFFISLYILILVLGSLILSTSYTLDDSIFNFASALGNVGIYKGLTLTKISPYIMWTLIVGMFVGRLEIFVIFKTIFRIKSDIKNNL